MAASGFDPGFRIVPTGRGFVGLGARSESDRESSAEAAAEALVFAWDCMISGKYDVLILDEINCAVALGLVPAEDVLRMIQEKPEGVELVLTGRSADSRILEAADLVTEMREVKHPYRDQGLKAQPGIDF